MYNASFPKAIVHVDADAFFAACEQAMNPRYKGQPVVVGADRGIATAVSYEAKRRGISRGMTIGYIKNQYPDVIILNGNYEAYSLFSRRLFAILKRFTSAVEEYSIDEGFLDITGLEPSEGMSYQEIAETIKKTVYKELNITVSVGLAPTKVLAKLACTGNKPNGFGMITQKDLPEYLRDFLVDSIWGVGRNTADYMRRLGIFSVYDFATQPVSFVEQHFTKPHRDIWHELNGVTVYPVITEAKNSFASISKTNTFRNNRNDRGTVYAELVQNIEHACIKARNYNLVAKRVSVFLKSESFALEALEIDLERVSAYSNDIIAAVRPLFERLYNPKIKYRATGVILSELNDACSIQTSLFEPAEKLSASKRICEAIDRLSARFGKNTVRSGGTLKANVWKKPLLHCPIVPIGFVN